MAGTNAGSEGGMVTESLPPARRTGLIVVVAALLLLLVAGIAGALLLLPASQGAKSQAGAGTTANKARFEAAIGVMKSLRINDIAAVRPFLMDTAQKAITDAQWLEAAKLSEVASGTFAPTAWSGTTTATVEYDIEGETGKMVFTANPDDPNVVTMTEIGIDGELVYDVEVKLVGKSWRAVALTPRTEPFNLDVEFVKSLVEPGEL